MKKIGLMIPNNSSNKLNEMSPKYFPFTIFWFKYRLLITNFSKHRRFWKLLFKIKGGEYIKSEKKIQVVDNEF